MYAGRGYGGGYAAAAVYDIEPHALQAHILYVFAANVVIRVKAVGEHVLELAAQCAELIVVAVDYGAPAFAYVFEYIGFFLQYAVTGAEEFYMSLAYIGYNAYGGAYYIRKGGYLAGGIGTHLYHRHPVFLVEAEQRQGHAGMVVEASFVLQRIELLAQHVGHKLLCCGLAHAAGYAHHGYIEYGAISLCHDKQCLYGGIHIYDRASIALFVFRKHGYRALINRLRNKIVTVEPFAYYWYEKAAGPYRPAVYRSVLYTPV